VLSLSPELLPLVEDDEWFFDTELLVTAQRIGLRIHEVPVDWVDDLDSRVDVLRTAWQDLRGVGRLARPAARRRATLRPARPRDGGWTHRTGRPPSLGAGIGWPGDTTARQPVETGRDPQASADELLRFAGVGVVSTAVYLAAVVALQTGLGIYPANAVAIAACSLGNTAVHRRLTRRPGTVAQAPTVAVSGALVAVSLGCTTAALAAVRAVGLTSLGPELLALTAANLGASIVRFGILRTWVFRPRFGTNHLAGDSTPRPITMSAS